MGEDLHQGANFGGDSTLSKATEADALTTRAEANGERPLQILAQWMSRYGDGLWSFAFAQLDQHAGADELTQMVFLHAYGHAYASFQSISAPQEAASQEPAADLRLFSLAYQLTSGQKEVVPARTWQLNRAWDALLNLRAVDRAIVLLRVREEFTFGQIAWVIDKPQAWVRSRFQKTADKLQTIARSSVATDAAGSGVGSGSGGGSGAGVRPGVGHDWQVVWQQQLQQAPGMGFTAQLRDRVRERITSGETPSPVAEVPRRHARHWDDEIDDAYGADSTDGARLARPGEVGGRASNIALWTGATVVVCAAIATGLVAYYHGTTHDPLGQGGGGSSHGTSAPQEGGQNSGQPPLQPSGQVQTGVKTQTATPSSISGPNGVTLVPGQPTPIPALPVTTDLTQIQVVSVPVVYAVEPSGSTTSSGPTSSTTSTETNATTTAVAGGQTGGQNGATASGLSGAGTKMVYMSVPSKLADKLSAYEIAIDNKPPIYVLGPAGLTGKVAVGADGSFRMDLAGYGMTLSLTTDGLDLVMAQMDAAPLFPSAQVAAQTTAGAEIPSLQHANIYQMKPQTALFGFTVENGPRVLGFADYTPNGQPGPFQYGMQEVLTTSFPNEEFTTLAPWILAQGTTMVEQSAVNPALYLMTKRPVSVNGRTYIITAPADAYLGQDQYAILTPKGVVWWQIPSNVSTGDPNATYPAGPYALYLSPVNATDLSPKTAQLLLTMPYSRGLVQGNDLYIYGGPMVSVQNFVVYSVWDKTVGMMQPDGNELHAYNLSTGQDTVIANFRVGGGNFFLWGSSRQDIVMDNRSIDVAGNMHDSLHLYDLHTGQQTPLPASDIVATNEVDATIDGKDELVTLSGE